MTTTASTPGRRVASPRGLDVVVVEALRTPIGRRRGAFSTVHPADLLGSVYRSVLDRTGLDPSRVDQLVAGCVTNVGEQSFDVARTAWLSAGLPYSVAGTTVDAHCGSSLQALSFAAGLIATGAAETVLAAGVESMSRVPLGTDTDNGPGKALPKSYFSQYEFTTQFEAAERMADKWGITRAEADAYGLRSQQRAARAWDEGRFERELIPIEAPVVDEQGRPTGATTSVTRDEGLRPTSLEQLATLRPVARPDGVHTAGTCSQISDGAAALLLMSRDRARELGYRPRARIAAHTLVGVDPVLMLTGPIDATFAVLSQAGMVPADVDVFEINEAFASVVLAWEREVGADVERVNPNGGAIALGHPVGCTGARLATTALYELERTDGTVAVLTLCGAAGIAPAMLLERL